MKARREGLSGSDTPRSGGKTSRIAERCQPVAHGMGRLLGWHRAAMQAGAQPLATGRDGSAIICGNRPPAGELPARPSGADGSFREGPASFGEGGECQTAFGEWQTAFGEWQTAFGEWQTAFGERRTAFGEWQTAFGERQTAFGERQTAFGERLGEGPASLGEGVERAGEDLGRAKVGSECPTASGKRLVDWGGRPPRSLPHSATPNVQTRGH